MIFSDRLQNTFSQLKRQCHTAIVRYPILGRMARLGMETVSATENNSTITDPPKVQLDFNQSLEDIGGFDLWHKRRINQKRQFTQLLISEISELKTTTKKQQSDCLIAANRLLSHEFNFLGSGPFVSEDLNRAQGEDGYQPIDWYLDPVRQLRFPTNVPYKDWNLFEMRPANADIKYPWELARCQHFLTLGQAFTLTGDDQYAVELTNQCRDFIEANPVGLGINWTCTMDVAIRAANWCLALNLISLSNAVSPEAWKQVYRHMFETGIFILDNLENNYETTSNHFLSNVVGLHILAAEFIDLDFAKEWDNYARKTIEREIDTQILEDGADFESSVPYHRLVTELFLCSWRVSQIQNNPLSDNYLTRLTSMVEFLEAVLRPDGTMPIVGDTDDGRLMIATGYGTWNPSDALHILAPAGMALNRPDWVARSGKNATWEAFWWGFDCSSTEEFSTQYANQETDNSLTRKLFPNSGIVVSRSIKHQAYLLITNGAVGTEGFGNHKHNDLLSFEFFDQGQALIIDPGSYVYTSDFEARNRYRGTAYHNTLRIDDSEQNEIQPAFLFRMFAKADPKHILFNKTEDGISYQGSHNGYATQLEQGVTHTRTFNHTIQEGKLLIEDKLEGTGHHDVEWFFHFHPSVKVELDKHASLVHLGAGSHNWSLSWSDENIRPALQDSFFSPSYGVQLRNTSLHLSDRVELSANYAACFIITRNEATI